MPKTASDSVAILSDRPLAGLGITGGDIATVIELAIAEEAGGAIRAASGSALRPYSIGKRAAEPSRYRGWLRDRFRPVPAYPRAPFAGQDAGRRDIGRYLDQICNISGNIAQQRAHTKTLIPRFKTRASRATAYFSQEQLGRRPQIASMTP